MPRSLQATKSIPSRTASVKHGLKARKAGALVGTVNGRVSGRAGAKLKKNSGGPTGTSLIENLKSGNRRFMSGQMKVESPTKEEIKKLATSQSPATVVLACSDSRVPPELVFDQKLGEMFTVRSAGETLSPQAIGSVEFAIESLSARLIVVLAHTDCGAIKAAVDTLNGSSTGSSNLDELVSEIHPRIRGCIKDGCTSKNLKVEAVANARGVGKELKLRSKLIAAAIESGRVQIEVALYNLESGEVEFY